MKDDLYEIANGGDGWTPDRIPRRPAPTPVVSRENIRSLRERRAIEEAARRAREEAELRAAVRAEAKRIARLVELRRRAAEAVDSVTRANLGKPRERMLITLRVAIETGTTVKDLRFGRSRRGDHVLPRHALMYALRTETSMSLPEIGRFMGGRDHTSVLHGIRKHAERNGLPVPGASPARGEA